MYVCFTCNVCVENYVRMCVWLSLNINHTPHWILIKINNIQFMWNKLKTKPRELKRGGEGERDRDAKRRM